MTNSQKHPTKNSPQCGRIKRVLASGTLGLLPLIILFGLTRDWDEGEWMPAITSGAMGVFMMILYLFDVKPYPLPRGKRQKHRKGGGLGPASKSFDAPTPGSLRT